MRIFYILLLTFFTGFAATAQDRDSSPRGGEPEARIVKFYPNPATSFITFDFQKEFDKSYSFQIFNFLGKKVYDVPSVTPKTVVNLNDFYRGVYIFQIRDKNGKIVDSGRFQVSK
jgi:Secretion system C-terminal sorting domain